MVYGLTPVHYVRYKLDIELLQLFLVAAIAEKKAGPAEAEGEAPAAEAPAAA